MRLQKICLLIFMMGFTCSIPAQSISEEGKHTLFFYPLHSTYDASYGSNNLSLLPGIGYFYRIKKHWSLQAKLFYRQFEDPLLRYGFSNSVGDEKNIKLGVQYKGGKKIHLLLSTSVYIEDRIMLYNRAKNPLLVNKFIDENEMGLDFGLGFGYQINKKVSLTFGTAIRYRRLNEKIPRPFPYPIWIFNAVESLGFGYTF